MITEEQAVSVAVVRRGLALAQILSCDVPITAIARRELDDAFDALERLAEQPRHISSGTVPSWADDDVAALASAQPSDTAQAGGVERGAKCGAAPDHADILETIENAADDWQKQGYTTALAEVRDMANVGRALMEALPEGYSYMNCPSEIVSDLQNERDEAAASPRSPNDRQSVEALRKTFRNAAKGHGRAGTADYPDGPYMSMDDAASVYADLMKSRAPNDDMQSVERAEAAQLNLYYQAERDRAARQRAEEAFDLIAPFVAKFAAAASHYDGGRPRFEGSTTFFHDADGSHNCALTSTATGLGGPGAPRSPTLGDLRMLAAAYEEASTLRRAALTRPDEAPTVDKRGEGA